MSEETLSDFYNRVYEEATDDERQEIDEKFEVSVGRKLEYGFSKSKFLGADVLRIAKAAKEEAPIKETLKAEADKEAEERAKKFADMSPAEQESGWALAGEIGGEIVDPFLIPLGYVGAVGKGVKVVKALDRLKSGAAISSISMGDVSLDMMARGEDIDGTTLAMAGVLGGVAGLALPVRRAADKIPTKKATPPLNKIEDVGEDGTSRSLGSLERPSVAPDPDGEGGAALRALREFAERDDTQLKSIKDLASPGHKIEWANRVEKLYKKHQKIRVAEKKTGRKSKLSMPEEEFQQLGAMHERANSIYDSLADTLKDHAEVYDDGLGKSIDELSSKGMLNGNTIRHLVYRPLIGAASGFGIGGTLNLYEDDASSYNPWAFAAVGLLGGVASKKIIKSKINSDVKEAGLLEINNTMRKSLWAQANMWFSGGMAARGNAIGGEVEVLTKNLMAQRGADLNYTAGISVEEAKGLAIQELLTDWDDALTDLGMYANTKKSEELKTAVYKLAEGFETTESLAAKGFSADDIQIAEKAVVQAKGLVSRVTDESEVAGLSLKQHLANYVLPQMHDIAKIARDPDNARRVYREAYRDQRLGGKEEVTDEMIAAVDQQLDDWFDGMLSVGEDRAHNAFALSTKDAPYKLDTVMRPLADHIEKPRMFNKFTAREKIQDYLVTDVDSLMKQYVHKTMPVVEFSRRFGSDGRGISAIQKSIADKYAKARVGASSSRLKELRSLERMEAKTVHDSVNAFFGLLHADHGLSQNQWAGNVMGLFSTGANMTYLTKVQVSSMGDILQPFQNSGYWNTIKAAGRSWSKKRGPTDFAEESGFARRDVLEQDMRNYIMEQMNPSSRLQSGLKVANEKYFKMVGLVGITRFAGRFAYNAGVEDAFTIAKKMSVKKTSKFRTKAREVGLKDEYIGILNRFDNVNDAWKSEDARRVLNIAGMKASDRDRLIPQLGNRRGFTQSKDPLMRSFGQFLSWAQAKTTQTNALIKRMENGDDALFARMVGLMAIYDGVLTFKHWLGDPSGEYLDLHEEGYTDRLTNMNQIAKTFNFSGNVSHWFIDKMSRLAGSHGGSGPLEEVVPAWGYATDLYQAFSPMPGGQLGSVWTNLQRDDLEGASLQTLRALPFGRDIINVVNSQRHPLQKLKDRPSPPRGTLPFRSDSGFATGGEVEDVPQVPKEPDERIDKLTGRPYNEQAGGAFIDAEDPLRRLGFVGGGLADNPLRRLGFGVGGRVPFGAAGIVAKKVIEHKDDILTGIKKLFGSPQTEVEKVMARPTSLRKAVDEPIEAVEEKVDEAIPTPIAQKLDEPIEEAPVERADEAIEAAPVKIDDNIKYSLELDDEYRANFPIDEVPKFNRVGKRETKVEKEYWKELFGPDGNRWEIFDEIPSAQLDVDGNFLMDPKDVAGLNKFLFDSAVLGERVPPRMRDGRYASQWNMIGIKPFESVPRPATRKEMYGALDSRKREKIDIEIPEGQKVGLRLDIPAYDKHNVWVPTIHDEGGETRRASYRATASIRDADLSMSDVNQARAKKIKEGGHKKPFARIGGKLINRTDEENYKLSQQYLNDPEWTQVGFNPVRHSYFFDRVSSEPVIGGSEAIQVGPLVLVKDAKFGKVSDFKYATGGKVYSALRRRKAEGGSVISEHTTDLSEPTYSSPILGIIADKRGHEVASKLKEHEEHVAIIESDDGVNMIQIGGGPGRGVYQYELGEDYGGSGANTTAINRYMRVARHGGYEIPPEYQKLLGGEDVDFSKLPRNLQRDIFYADKEQDEAVILDDIKDLESSVRVWGAGHKKKGVTEDMINQKIERITEYYNLEAEKAKDN